MPKRSQIHLAAILAVVTSCWSKGVPVVPSTVLTAPDGVMAWGRDNRTEGVDGRRREGSVCEGGIISAVDFLNAIRRLLVTEDTPTTTTTSTNRSNKKPTEDSRTKLSRNSLTPNDVTKVRQQLRHYNAMASIDGPPSSGLNPGPARDRLGNRVAPAPFQVVGPFTEKDLRMLLRETAGRRKQLSNLATTGGEGDNSNVMKTTQRQPTNTPPSDDNLRQLDTPPLKDIALVVNDGRRAVHSVPIVFAPGMNVNSALTQAAILFDGDTTSDVNPFDCDVTRSRSLLCYVIKECAGNIINQWQRWNIKVKDARAEVVSRGVCLPSRPLMPGYSVDISYINTQSV